MKGESGKNLFLHLSSQVIERFIIDGKEALTCSFHFFPKQYPYQFLKVQISTPTAL